MTSLERRIEKLEEAIGDYHAREADEALVARLSLIRHTERDLTLDERRALLAALIRLNGGTLAELYRRVKLYRASRDGASWSCGSD